MTDGITCPECLGDVLWLGGTQVSKSNVRSLYQCCNPDCVVTSIELVVEE